MIRKVKSWVFTRHYGLKEWQRELKNQWFSNPRHEWMVEDRYIRANLEDFIELLPKGVTQFLCEESIELVLSTGQFSLSIARTHQSFVVVFPELKKMLTAALPTDGFVILAHEIGHLYYGHHKVAIDPLEAQVEADQFTVELGLGEDLESFLLDLPESTEKRVRLSHLTSLTAQNQ